ncbi:hypothetical protein M0L20_28485 [Spirosoma sp. RP8]|uniref:Uncharacterized protein n=2 Tax=Spirosoma liriopis TaxID=2937440 RepID=A0ABT0HUQ3_9BACT|nr:hypothetical protein [Spirosoma liriopis]
MNWRDAWRKAAQQAEDDKPRLIDRRMDLEEWDNWPIDGQLFDTSHRKTIWQILTRT